MQVNDFVWGLRGLASSQLAGSVVAVGAFDGVHLGHQALISRLRTESENLGLPSVVILFEPQPNEYFAKGDLPARLTRLREKVEVLKSLGVNRVICLHFNKVLRAYTPLDFVERLLVQQLGLKFLVVGDDFRFGVGGAGNYEVLCSLGLEFDFSVTDTSSFQVSRSRVSSTIIRGLLAEGKFFEAKAMLGRAYSTLGRVVYGKQLGRTIGFPTLNINLGRKVSPLRGVYAVNVNLHGESYEGVANVGFRPTVNTLKKPQLEVHLLDVNVDAYGEFARVEYVEKIRDELKFESVSDLKKQIEKDVVTARLIFKKQKLV